MRKDKSRLLKVLSDLVRDNGEIILHAHKRKFLPGIGITKLKRRRKIDFSGYCYVSEDSFTGWTPFTVSCFLLEDRGPRSVRRTIKLMQKHDEEENVKLDYAIVKGKKVKL